MQITVAMCRAFLPDMAEKGAGHVLNVSSMAANFAMPYKSVYSASKAFVRAFTIGIRGEMKPFGVSVSVVQPGAMLTNPVVIEQLRYGSAMARVSAMNPDEVAESALEGMMRGKAVIVPGIKNWLTLGMLRVFPRPLKSALAIFNYVRTRKKSNG
jgi:short-subunit dehydrogenase